MRDCEEMRLLVQADADGELDPAEAAAVAAHVAACPDCAALQERLGVLRQDLRAGLPYHPPAPAFRRRMAGLLAGPAARAIRRGRWTGRAMGFGAGAAVAAGLLLALLPAGGGSGAVDAVVAGHIRALQPGHLMDVVSTDQHTVKPWFDGRLDYAPPVKDLAAQGFPLVGGRLDYLDGRPVAALVYRHALHVIDLFIWPDPAAAAAPSSVTRDGYQVIRWSQDGMTFRAVSDVAAADLEHFVADWKAAK
jgi:anti-sigma factor RsiW